MIIFVKSPNLKSSALILFLLIYLNLKPLILRCSMLIHLFIRLILLNQIMEAFVHLAFMASFKDPSSFNFSQILVKLLLVLAIYFYNKHMGNSMDDNIHSMDNNHHSNI